MFFSLDYIFKINAFDNTLNVVLSVMFCNIQCMVYDTYTSLTDTIGFVFFL